MRKKYTFILPCLNEEKTLEYCIKEIQKCIEYKKLDAEILVSDNNSTDNSVEIAKILGISEKLISLTIVAFSTSLPELITSIAATRKGETDMAIGNILGSQLFNILLIIGVSAALTPINYSKSYDS